MELKVVAQTATLSVTTQLIQEAVCHEKFKWE